MNNATSLHAILLKLLLRALVVYLENFAAKTASNVSAPEHHHIVVMEYNSLRKNAMEKILQTANKFVVMLLLIALQVALAIMLRLEKHVLFLGAVVEP